MDDNSFNIRLSLIEMAVHHIDRINESLEQRDDELGVLVFHPSDYYPILTEVKANREKYPFVIVNDLNGRLEIYGVLLLCSAFIEKGVCKPYPKSTLNKWFKTNFGTIYFNEP